MFQSFVLEQESPFCPQCSLGSSVVGGSLVVGGSPAGSSVAGGSLVVGGSPAEPQPLALK